MLEKDLSVSTPALKSRNVQSPKPDSQNFKPFGQDGISFLDFLDIINPLQHIPFVSTIYRNITGDIIDPASKIAGSGLYGGAIGAVTSLFDVMIEHTTGKDIVGHALEKASQNDEHLGKFARVNQDKTIIDAAATVNYWPKLSATITAHEQNSNAVIGVGWSNGSTSKSNTSNLTIQSLLLKKIYAEINIEKQMTTNKKVQHNQAIGAYKDTALLIRDS